MKLKKLESIFKKFKHEDINIPTHQRDWKNFEQNNETIVLNVLFASQNSEEICLYINQNIISSYKITWFCQ